LARGEIEEALLNLRKAVMRGYQGHGLMYFLEEGHRKGYITKKEYNFTLRAHNAACDEMRSEARDDAKKAWG